MPSKKYFKESRLKIREKVKEKYGLTTADTLTKEQKKLVRKEVDAKMWEKITLSKNYKKALEQIDQELLYWPEFMIHKNKQRLTLLTQMLIRTRRLLLKNTPKLIGINKKIQRREIRKEQT